MEPYYFVLNFKMNNILANCFVITAHLINMMYFGFLNSVLGYLSCRDTEFSWYRENKSAILTCHFRALDTKVKLII